MYRTACFRGSLCVGLSTFVMSVAAGCNDGAASSDADNTAVEQSSEALSSDLGALTLLAGSVTDSGSADGVASTALFGGPYFTAMDGAGNLYVADTASHTIRKVSSAGVVTTLAGVAGQAGSADGTGAFARFSSPYGIAVDVSGNVYVGDTGNHTVRRIRPSGAVTTIAGYPGLAGRADGTGAAARFSNPLGVAVAASGDVFVVDHANYTIRKISPTGIVSTLAGTPGLAAGTDGVGAAARFNHPTGIALTASGDLLVTDRDNATVRRVTQAGVVTTIAGTAGQAGNTDGTGQAARFNQPWDLAVDSTGTVYVADTGNHLLRQISPTGVVTKVAGVAGSPGYADGIGELARFYTPAGVETDSSGNIYVTDRSTAIIRKVTPGGTVSTFAGSAGVGGSADGIGTSAARFSGPWGVAVDSNGDYFVADRNNHVIRKVTPDGTVTTFAGSPGQAGTADGSGVAARFNSPLALAYDGAGNFYVADYGNSTIRRIGSSGDVSTLAGLAGQLGSTDGAGQSARFRGPADIAFDGTSYLYVADHSNHTIRRVTLDGAVTTIAGSPGQAGCIDGSGADARFNLPIGVVVESTSNLAVTESANHTIRRITPLGDVTTIAGSCGLAGMTNGLGTNARFNSPIGIRRDASNNLFVADSNNHVIRKINSAGIVTTFAGYAGQAGVLDGIFDAARFYTPVGIGLDGTGNLLVADYSNHAVRKITPSAVVTTVTGTPGGAGYSDGIGTARFNAPYAVANDLQGYVYVADTSNNTIRSISPSGIVTTLAGSAGETGYLDGTGAAARFWHPGGIAVDEAGSVYVADSWNNVIRKLTRSATVPNVYTSTTLAGTSAQFSTPNGIAVDGFGQVYVADTNNHTIRKISPAGVVTVLAGGSGMSGSDDGIGSAARFYRPTGVAVDDSGNVYVADNSNHTVRKITPTGAVTTLAGFPTLRGTTDGVGGEARFNSPYGIGVDAAGNVYVTDSGNYTVRRITPGGLVTTLVGVPGQPQTLLQPLPASIKAPYGIAVDRVTASLYLTVDSAILVASNPVSIATGNGTTLYPLTSQQQTLTASGGHGPYTWTLATNNSGATITTDGIYTAGTQSGVTDSVMVTDANGARTTIQVTVVGPITVQGNAASAVGVRQSLTVLGGSGDYAWELTTNNSGGSITPEGLYTAGSVSGVRDRVTAKDIRSGLVDTFDIAVGPQPASVPALPVGLLVLLGGVLLAFGNHASRRRHHA